MSFIFLSAPLAVCGLVGPRALPPSAGCVSVARAAGEQQTVRVIWKRLECGNQVAVLGEDDLRTRDMGCHQGSLSKGMLTASESAGLGPAPTPPRRNMLG